jgi:hypothetical protein
MRESKKSDSIARVSGDLLLILVTGAARTWMAGRNTAKRRIAQGCRGSGYPGFPFPTCRGITVNAVAAVVPARNRRRSNPRFVIIDCPPACDAILSVPTAVHSVRRFGVVSIIMHSLTSVAFCSSIATFSGAAYCGWRLDDFGCGRRPRRLLIPAQLMFADSSPNARGSCRVGQGRVPCWRVNRQPSRPVSACCGQTSNRPG